MFGGGGLGGMQQTTSYKVVLPFYAYAALSFLVACILLLFHTNLADQHYFFPGTLSITHLMALGWCTMIIMGASHQLVPVLIEGKLASERLAFLSFLFCALGIPLLVCGFYEFNTGWPLQTGAILINLGVICFLANMLSSVVQSKQRDVHSWYMAAASLWLFSTTFFGLLLVFNFQNPLLPKGSVSYLSLHAHMGLAGWFLLLVIGVASRLIPMFLISKYTNRKRLWWVFGLVNGGLITFILMRLAGLNTFWYYVPLLMVLAAILLFAGYCRAAYKVRIRKNVDAQVNISLISVAQMLLPLIALAGILVLKPEHQTETVLVYGFCIFFGWLSALIMGMTFKTLPFIVWNKVYHHKAHASAAPAPKELFNEKIFGLMKKLYLAGFVVFIAGIFLKTQWLLILGASALLLAAILYVTNVGITLTHKPKS
ncbi:MAG: cytochrome C oxidase subunit I [Bacteroidetes bacterium]|nr:cytochrome C oxidase subunit I [Bacteroidota bacterium]MBS1629464.1 cytochrome C oxidase subunit I [Bacteroidota bacterium]